MNYLNNIFKIVKMKYKVKEFKVKLKDIKNNQVYYNNNLINIKIKQKKCKKN